MTRKRPRERTRRGPAGRPWLVETLEGRVLLSLSYQQHPVPADRSFLPAQVIAGPNGNVWFTEGPASIDPLNPAPPLSLLGEITPTGAVSFLALPPKTGIGSIVDGPDGNVWFTAETSSPAPPPPPLPPGDSYLNPVDYVVTTSIDRITPAGQITSFPLPNAVHVPSYPGLASGPGGDLWLATNNAIDRITTAGLVTVFPIGTRGVSSITAGPDGNVWFSDLAGPSDAPGISRLTPSGDLTRFAVPSADFFPDRLIAGPDGDVWFVASLEKPNFHDVIGKISPDGVVTEFPTPANIQIGALAASGGNNDVWFTANAVPDPYATGSVEIGRITPQGAVTIDPGDPSQSGYAGAITFGPDGNLYYTERFSQTIGEALVPKAAVSGVERLYPPRLFETQVVLTFTAPLDPASAQDLNNYSLQQVRQGRRGTVVVRSVRLDSAVYDPATNTVRLAVRGRIGPLRHDRITVNGSTRAGLAAANGERLAGASGLPGTNFQAIVPRALRRVHTPQGAAPGPGARAGWLAWWASGLR